MIERCVAVYRLYSIKWMPLLTYLVVLRVDLVWLKKISSHRGKQELNEEYSPSVWSFWHQKWSNQSYNTTDYGHHCQGNYYVGGTMYFIHHFASFCTRSENLPPTAINNTGTVNSETCKVISCHMMKYVRIVNKQQGWELNHYKTRVLYLLLWFSINKVVSF